MEKEMNFFDLCVACGRAIGRACVALWHVLERMIRLTYRYWYIVITLIVLALACAVYLTRKDNITQLSTNGEQRSRMPVRVDKHVGRNDPCPCGSGLKYKNCHGKGQV